MNKFSIFATSLFVLSIVTFLFVDSVFAMRGSDALRGRLTDSLGSAALDSRETIGGEKTNQYFDWFGRDFDENARERDYERQEREREKRDEERERERDHQDRIRERDEFERERKLDLEEAERDRKWAAELAKMYANGTLPRPMNVHTFVSPFGSYTIASPQPSAIFGFPGLPIVVGSPQPVIVSGVLQTGERIKRNIQQKTQHSRLKSNSLIGRLNGFIKMQQMHNGKRNQ